MKKFSYLIIDFYYGSVIGTNDKEKATEFSQVEEFAVIDLTTGQLLVEGELKEVNELGAEEETQPDPELSDTEDTNGETSDGETDPE